MKTNWWIGEKRSRAVTTLLVQARTKREAQEKFNAQQGEEVDLSHYGIGRVRVIRRDKGKTK